MLLTRAHADRAREVLGVLSRRFLALRLSSIETPGLASGHAGIALAHVALDRVFPGAGHADRARRTVDRAIEALATMPLGASLHGGFTGIAWVVELLHGDPNAPPDEDPLAAIDDALATHVALSPWTGPYDLIEGLTGFGVYALERTPRASGAKLVAEIVDRLAETSVRQRPGVAWRSDPEWVTPAFRPDPPLEWNLGAAHGVPGVIAFLGGACAAEVDSRTKRKAHALLEKAVAWLLAQELPRDCTGRFANASGPGLAKTPARTAWCYGDPGLAACLLVAARATGERAWEKHAVRIALAATKRAHDERGIIDAGICHGAAGLAHIYHRIHLTTGDDRFARAARECFAETLALRGASGGFGGFRSWGPGADAKMRWNTDASFLTGAAGIALALASALGKAEPAWDRALLLSARGRA